ncbi:hypothetical protein ACOMHN_017395 [Nucella lapillus]
METWVRTLSLCMVLGVTAAWTYSLNRKNFRAETYPFPWAPARRSSYVPCAYTGRECQTTSQCCNDHDVCLTSAKYNFIPWGKDRISTCVDMRKEMKYGKAAGKIKSSGQICSDSGQCAEQCCREVRGHRARYYVCGTPEDEFTSYTCIRAARSGNDVLDDLM